MALQYSIETWCNNLRQAQRGFAIASCTVLVSSLGLPKHAAARDRGHGV
jgi:hypothetical protein